ncbi:MAG: hypothetical protein U0X91_16510 [Spirosomataceae bacterium]
MKSAFLLLICLFITAYTSVGQTNNYFPQLTKLRIEGGMRPAIFGYDKSAVKLIRKKAIQLPKNDPWYCPDPDAPCFEKVAAFQHPLFKDSLYVLFSFGPSEDPNFAVGTKEGKMLGNINGLEFYLTNNNTFYINGHTNNLFNKKRKFEIRKDTVTEVIQPFYYVGLQSVTLTNVVLYQSKTGPETVASLPKGYKVEVVLAEYGKPDFELETHFLVKTDYGLMGWLRLNPNDSPDKIIKGLFFAGD